MNTIKLENRLAINEFADQRLINSNLGWSVSMYEDTAVVGAYSEEFEGSAATGAAYVYTRTSGVWTQQQKLVGSGINGRIASDIFGWSVSVYEDTVVVGATGQSFDASGSNSLFNRVGAAYIYTRTSGVWTQQQKLVGSGTNGRIAFDQFGYSVSISSDTVVVGAN
jgi:hypothetical protein